VSRMIGLQPFSFGPTLQMRQRRSNAGNVNRVTDIVSRGYARPEVLVSTQWVEIIATIRRSAW